MAYLVHRPTEKRPVRRARPVVMPPAIGVTSSPWRVAFSATTGDGGRGGHVFAYIDPSLNTLVDYRYSRRHEAKRGQHGMGSDMFGAAGDDITLKMPVGTIISDYETGEPIADLTTHGERLCLAQGGVGGWGNIHFKSSTNRAPRQKTNGKPGERRKLKLELKVLEIGRAHV